MTKEAKVFFLRPGLQETPGFPPKHLMKTDTDQERHEVYRHQVSEYLKAVLRGYELSVLLEGNLPHVFPESELVTETLHSCCWERLNHLKHSQIGAISLRFCNSREITKPSMQVGLNLFLLLQSRGHIFKQQL